MSDTRASFVAHFGEEEACRIEAAADRHANGINSGRQGSDPFRWAICITIGYECWSRFAAYHGITTPAPAIRQWIKDHANLGEHDGDVDGLALFGGRYNEYIVDSEK